MMPNTPIVARDLDKVRRDLQDATEHLSRPYGSGGNTYTALAIEAIMRAVASVALAVERLAELPACDGGHA